MVGELLKFIKVVYCCFKVNSVLFLTSDLTKVT